MKLLKILAGILLVSSCGFQPLYVQRDNSSSWYFSDKFDTSIVEELAKIKVVAIKDRFGQQMRNHLLDLLTPKGVPSNPQYRLVVEVVGRMLTGANPNKRK